MAKYTLPRFMSETTVEEMSKDNFEWLNSATRWCKFYPATGVDAVFINWDHPANMGKDFLTVTDEYRKLHGF